MARLPYLDRDDLPEEHRSLLDRPINLFRALAHNPEVLSWMERIGKWIRFESRLDPRLRELAILQVGYSSRSDYEFSHHVAIGKGFGVTDADLEALVAESRGEDSGLPPAERAVLRAARELTEGTTLDEGTWRALRDSFELPEIVELIFVITHYAQVVRVLGALEVDVEPEYVEHLELLRRPHP